MLNIYLSIDDTDNATSPGSGHVAEILSNRLKHEKLSWRNTSVSRHQLHLHDDIPFTSHNSAMCFTAVTTREKLEHLIQFSAQFLVEHSAEGSDPGLCVAVDNDSLNCSALVDFGLAAKDGVLSKNEAYKLAEKMNIHLSEHGGSGDGIIGALAGTGLRMHGNDGRFRGWLEVSGVDQIVSAGYLRRFGSVADVVDNDGCILPDQAQVKILEKQIKSVVYNHHQVIPVKKCGDAGDERWTTLSKEESKQF